MEGLKLNEQSTNLSESKLFLQKSVLQGFQRLKDK